MIAEARMSFFYPVVVRRSGFARSIGGGARLSLKQAVLVIAALSLLCWAILIALLMGLRAVL